MANYIFTVKLTFYLTIVKILGDYTLQSTYKKYLNYFFFSINCIPLPNQNEQCVMLMLL